MLIEIVNSDLFTPLIAAQNSYADRQFKRARNLRDNYIQKYRPEVLAQLKKYRPSDCIRDLSIVVVAYNTGDGLPRCLDSIAEQARGVGAEVILVDNGGNDKFRSEILTRDLVYITLPMNIGPSEARNIGASVACGKILVFIDDDAVLCEGCLSAVVDAFERFDFAAIRGRILPLDLPENCLPGHYDLGKFPIPAVLETEGAMAVREELWTATRGMDPMLFGAEGVEFTERIFSSSPSSDIYYWPEFCIKHDYAVGQSAEKKLARHRTAASYFSEYGKSAKHMAVQYGLWYQARPAGSIRYDQRSLGQKIKAALRELVLRKKSVPHQVGNSESLPTDSSLPLNMFSKDLLIQKVQDAERREELLELNLRTILCSPAYLLGRSIAKCIKNPLGGLLRFPGDFFSIARDVFSSKKKINDPVVVVGEAIHSYTNPGREEHRCRLFKPAVITAGKARSKLRLGCIVPENLLESFTYECECGVPDAEDLDEWFESFEPEFLIASQVYDGRKDLLERVYRECLRRGIPSVFWFTGDVEAYPDFKEISLLADRCYAASMETVEFISKVRDCGYLPPAIQPALHNPLTVQGDTNYVVNDAVCFDGWADLIEFQGVWDDVFTGLKDIPVHVYESRWSFMANKLNDIPEWKSSIQGCVSSDELRTIYKSYPVLIQGDMTLSSKFSRATAALQAIACGAFVISIESENLMHDLGISSKAYLSESSSADLREVVGNILDNPEREQIIHRARRELYDKHTFSARLRTICADLDVQFEDCSMPRCTMITPTKRPLLIESVLEHHRKQTYANVDSIVILNNTDCDVERVRKLCREYNATLLVLPEEHTIGECLNEGISHAGNSMWFKIDDDDLYGDNYVKDMVHAWLMSGADLFGKAAGYIYFESDDSLWRRATSMARPDCICKSSYPHMSGATFAGSISSGSNLFFSSKHRACVDSLFFEQALRNDCLVHMTDNFNFVAYRGADKSKHTWRQQDHELQRNAEYVGNGESIGKIMI